MVRSMFNVKKKHLYTLRVGTENTSFDHQCVLTIWETIAVRHAVVNVIREGKFVRTVGKVWASSRYVHDSGS